MSHNNEQRKLNRSHAEHPKTTKKRYVKPVLIPLETQNTYIKTASAPFEATSLGGAQHGPLGLS